MEFLIRFAQTHENFRRAEIEALAQVADIRIEWISYSEESPFGIVRLHGTTAATQSLPPNDLAASLVSRSILANSIHELWGSGTTYATLHTSVQQTSSSLWPLHLHASFRFTTDSFQGTRPHSFRQATYESFSYMAFQGPIQMSRPANLFTIFEAYPLDNPEPTHLYLGRHISDGARKLITTYSLKKRRYISTTSMDAELALITANISRAAAGKLVYDPFMGTGSFPVACAAVGAVVWGSDMDGRAIRGAGKGDGVDVKGNFGQYGTAGCYLGGFVADLTNSPVRLGRDGGGGGGRRFLDAVICDPPYGVREGLKVLGSTRAKLQEVVYLADGTPAHLGPNYVPPKKAYSFERMLDDVLDFASRTLVDDGRLCMWVPVAGASDEDGEEQKEFVVPVHPALKLANMCTQVFNKWSRSLLTYERLSDQDFDQDELLTYRAARALSLKEMRDEELGNWYKREEGFGAKARADDLNDFRRKYFKGFKDRKSVVPIRTNGGEARDDGLEDLGVP